MSAHPPRPLGDLTTAARGQPVRAAPRAQPVPNGLVYYSEATTTALTRRRTSCSCPASSSGPRPPGAGTTRTSPGGGGYTGIARRSSWRTSARRCSRRSTTYPPSRRPARAGDARAFVHADGALAGIPLRSTTDEPVEFGLPARCVDSVSRQRAQVHRLAVPVRAVLTRRSCATGWCGGAVHRRPDATIAGSRSGLAPLFRVVPAAPARAGRTACASAPSSPATSPSTRCGDSTTSGGRRGATRGFTGSSRRPSRTYSPSGRWPRRRVQPYRLHARGDPGPHPTGSSTHCRPRRHPDAGPGQPAAPADPPAPVVPANLGEQNEGRRKIRNG